MAKKHQFPASTHLVARIEAVLAARSACRTALTMVNEFAMAHVPEQYRGILQGNIDAALEALRLADRAVSGDDAEE